MIRAFAVPALAACCAVATLASCSRPAAPAVPLPPRLAAIQCPADEQDHATGTFAKAKVTFACLAPERARKPDELRCDPTSRPTVCDDSGSIQLSRTKDGVVHWGVQIHPDPDTTAPGEGPTDESTLELNFRPAPLPGRTFEVKEDAWHLLLDGGQDALPVGFTFARGTPCDRESTVLNSGSCNLEARTGSLYWNISVRVHHRKGTTIQPREYITELQYWMPYLDAMVADPKP